MSETAGPTKYRVLSHPDEGPLWADRGVHAGSSPVKAIEAAVAARKESDGPEAEMNTEWVAIPERSFKPLLPEVQLITKVELKPAAEVRQRREEEQTALAVDTPNKETDCSTQAGEKR